MLYEYIEPLHPVVDEEKVSALVSAMRAYGWNGRPVLTIDALEYEIALTGTHRLAAAEQAGIAVPTLAIDQSDIVSEQGYELMVELKEADDDEDRLRALEKLYNLGLVTREAFDLMALEIKANYDDWT